MFTRKHVLWITQYLNYFSCLLTPLKESNLFNFQLLNILCKSIDFVLKKIILNVDFILSSTIISRLHFLCFNSQKQNGVKRNVLKVIFAINRSCLAPLRCAIKAHLKIAAHWCTTWVVICT